MEQKIYKTIYAHVYDPASSFFKSNRNDKAECQVVSCCNSNNCDLYKRKECCLVGSGLEINRCLYGKCLLNSGYSRRSRNYSKWIVEHKKEYESVLNALSSASRVMAIVGDFVYLPYSFITMNPYVPFSTREGLFFKKGDPLLPKEHLTIENIVKICDFRPQAMMGGEITSYQKEEIPKFVKHLSEFFPNLYAELVTQIPRMGNISLTNIGRKAYLFSLIPNVGEFVDCHKSHWCWDGEYLMSGDSKASFMLVDKFTEIKIKPTEDAVVTITDEKQVGCATKFYKS